MNRLENCQLEANKPEKVIKVVETREKLEGETSKLVRQLPFFNFQKLENP